VPANLPPEYFEVEKRYRGAKSAADKIAAIEAMLAVVPKHKGTDKLRADLRRRLSKLRSRDQIRKPTGKKDADYRIERHGAAQVVLVGPPNVGKSALVAALTNAAPEVADFPHTTRKPFPAMMPYKDITIQLIDTPPVTRQCSEPRLLDMLRKADMVLVVVDVSTDPSRQLGDVAAILKGSYTGSWKVHQGGNTGPASKPVLVVANKSDDFSKEEDFEIFRELVEEDWPMLAVSAKTGRNLNLMKQRIFECLKIVRVYTKAPGKEPDYTEPFVLKKGSTVEDLAAKIHRDFPGKLKCARVWGKNVYDGQMVHRGYLLEDGDVIELRL